MLAKKRHHPDDNSTPHVDVHRLNSPLTSTIYTMAGEDPRGFPLWLREAPDAEGKVHPRSGEIYVGYYDPERGFNGIGLTGRAEETIPVLLNRGYLMGASVASFDVEDLGTAELARVIHLLADVRGTMNSGVLSKCEEKLGPAIGRALADSPPAPGDEQLRSALYQLRARDPAAAVSDDLTFFLQSEQTAQALHNIRYSQAMEFGGGKLPAPAG